MRELPVVPLCRRHPCLCRRANQNDLLAHPVPPRGALRGRHGRWERDAVDALAVHRRAQLRRTAKSCGSGAPKQALRSRRRSRVLRVTVATKRWSPGRARISRKTIAQGMPAGGLKWWSQHRVFFSLSEGNSSSASAGVFQPSVFLGRPLRAAAIAISRGAWTLRSVPFGKYCCSSPLVFSFVPRCQGLRGSQK